ncbi:MAG: acyltransferase [Muribaculaceae bacterium]|nr:acyltransferase [Muribaculaceae bacterium]
MSWTLAILIAILFALAGKWILLVVVIPYIRWFNHPSRHATMGIHQVAACGEEGTARKGFIGRLKKQARRYLEGYSRYMDLQVGLIPSHHVRNWIYRNVFGVRLDSKAVIYYGAEIRWHSKLSVGKGSIIGDRAILDARNGIEIGKNVNFSSEVQIWTEQHMHRDPWFRCISDRSNAVVIEDRVWIGPRVTILPSVKIGEGAVIGAGAVVTKDVEPYSIMVGIPAHKVGNRITDLKYEFSGEYTPFL